ncbi:MAG: lipid-A-disaccharide synthase [Candidatus Wenzhouxiangella sp. M2_3B_020]
MRIAIGVGERSGDELAARIAEAIRLRAPEAELLGITGPRLRAAGVDSLADVDALGVMGLFEVVRHLPRLYRLRRRLHRSILEADVDAFVGVDSPDFNLGLARSLRRRGVRTVQVVAPSVWAWRRYRVARVARSLDLLLTLFPFEPPLFASAGLDARFVGHPLADEMSVEPDRAGARAALADGTTRPVVALLPGSRLGEIRRHAGLVTELGRRLVDEAGAVALLLLADDAHAAPFRDAAAEDPEQAGLRVVAGRTREGLAAADVAAAASGTVTLECLLSRTPMTVFYRLPAATYRLAATLRLVRSRWVSLPNVLAGESLVPERIQHQATPQRLFEDVVGWLDDSARRRAFAEKAGALHAELANGAAEAAAAACLEAARKRRR